MFIDTSGKFRAFTRIIIITCIALILILSGFQSIPLSWDESQTTTIQQQGSISQRIAKNVLIMAYIPSRRVNAVNELQNLLPNFESGQRQISLLPPTAQSILSETGPDYQDIDTAAKKILSKPDQPADPIQVAIILDHERNYYLSISQAVSVLKVTAVNRKVGLLVIEILIELLLLIIGISFWVTVERLIKRYEAIEKQRAEKQQQGENND
jgi:hypothetical protein